MSHRFVAVCWLFFCWAQWAWAQSPAEVYLDRMSHSFRELDYRGVFTYEYGNQMESLRIVHAVRDGVEKERLSYLNGDTREYFRDGHELSCIHPGHQKLRLDKHIASGPFAHRFLELENITDHYHLTLGESTRVADRIARELIVQSKDPYRYGFRLYLDEQTGLLLKSMTLGPRGQILERFQFTKLEIGVAIDDGSLTGSAPNSSHILHHVLEHDVAPSQLDAPKRLEPQWLPPGFSASARSSRQRDSGRVQFIMYTDGFATLTLIVEEVASAQALPTDGRARQGATVAYMRQLTADGQTYLLTVVGEVPLMTARKVARSVRIKQV